MTTAIRTEGLVKDYGKVRALAGLDLEVEAGQVFGFLGPNGAGKSTTIRLMLDLLRPTAGTVEVLGQSPAAGGPALRTRIGYLPGELGLPTRKTAGEYLGYLAGLRGGRGADRIAELAGRFGLELHRPLRALSKGNKQKVTIVQAFMHDPELLVLDEPTASLDPLLQMEFRALVTEARERGATVFLSSHVLAEVEDIADRVAIVRAGRIVDVDDVAALRERAGQHVLLRFAEPLDPGEVVGLPGLTDVVVDGTTVTGLLHGEPAALLAVAARHRVVRWQAQDRDLEDLFMDFYRDAPDRDAPEAVAPAAPDVASPAPDVPAPTGGTQR
jgi:ABC-2 type transport system ATP-binding protein